MGLFRTWVQLQNELGQQVGDFGKDTTIAIGAQVCKLYRKYPNSWLISPFGRGFLGNVCPPLGETPPFPSDPGFQGGQCPGVVYRITFINTITNITNCQTFVSPAQQVDVTGAIAGFRFTQAGGSFTSDCIGTNLPAIQGNFVVDHGGGTTVLVSGNFGLESEIAGLDSGYGQIEIVSIQRLDGLPDDCGNPPNVLPPDEPIDPNDFSGEFTINNYDTNNNVIGNNTYNFDFGDTTNLTFPINLRFGDTDVNVNFEGFDFSDNPSGDGANDSLDNTKRPFNPKRYNEEDVPPSDQNNTDSEGGSDVGDIIDETIEWALVTVTTLPGKGKIITHTLEGDLDVFAGYFSWVLETDEGRFRYPQIPIRKVRTALKSPPEALGLTYYSVNDAKIKVKIFRRKI